MKKQTSFLSLFGSFILASAFLPNALQAQSIKIFGTDSFATSCYQDSVLANRLGSAKFSDLESCNKAIEYGHLHKKDLIATHVNRGILYAAMGNLGHAAKDYSRALDLSGEVPEAYLNRGNLWFLASRFREAISDYDKAQELELRQIHILFLNRGMAYENLGLFDKAEENYLASLDIAPDWSLALEKLKRVGRKKLDLESGS